MLEPADGAQNDNEDEHSEPVTPADPKKAKGGGATILGAAMLAVGDIFEPEKTDVEIVQTNDDAIDDLPFNIDFGDLPPLS